MSLKGSEDRAPKKSLTSTVKENPLASVAIAAISSALVTFLSQTYATTSYVQAQREDMIEYFNQKTEIVAAKSETNAENIVKLENKLESMDDKLDLIKERVYSLKAR